MILVAADYLIIKKKYKKYFSLAITSGGLNQWSNYDIGLYI